jgi:atypical dual specificity phosphatase
LADAVDFICAQIAHEHSVLVHCLGGLGRTGTVLAYYLMKSKELDPKTAISEVRRSRPSSIEPEQEASLLKYLDARKSSEKQGPIAC